MTNWDNYYQKIKGREARPLLSGALNRLPNGLDTARLAIDLGCGDGTETALLLEKGWHVLAVDGEAAAIKYLMQKIPRKHQGRLETQVAKFQNVVLSRADLIHASLSLPFCHPTHFPQLWEKITSALNSNGHFVGQFFGPNDSWAIDNTEMTFHSLEQVHQLLVDFEIETIVEKDEDGEATSGPKHWHVFDVIARKL